MNGAAGRQKDTSTAASLPLGQIGVDFDIPQSNLVGLQVDFGNQKSNRYARGNRRIFRICEPIYGSQNAKLSDAALWRCWSSARGERSSLSNASTIRRSLRPLNSRRNFLESASHPGPLDRQNSEVSLAWLAQT